MSEQKNENKIESETEIIVRYAETDQMGIVHHSVYPIWYEVGRTEFAKEIGINYSKMEELGIKMPLVELACKYYEPVHYEDELIIKTSINKITPARIVFNYKVINKENNKMLGIGSTMHAWVGKDLRPINLKKHFPEIYQKFCEKCIEQIKKQ